MAASDPTTPGTVTGSARLRDLIRAREFAQVLPAAAAVLEAEPGNRDALLFRAIALRSLGQVAQAQEALDELGRQYPSFSRLHEERGMCFVALRQAPQAIESFLAAVRANHALPASWSMLAGLHRMAGDAANAAGAQSQLDTMRAIAPDVVAATSLFLDGDLAEAESLIRSCLLRRGDDVEAMRLLARIGIARKVYDDPALLLRRLLEMAPDYRAARAEYAEVLIELHRYTEARGQLERLIAEDPENAHYLHSLLAATLVGLGEVHQAIDVYRKLVAQAPEDPDLHLALAHTLKTTGATADAVREYHEAARLRPEFGDAYWSLANLKTYRFSEDEVQALRELESRPALATADRYHIDFALGKALEDRGQYEESFRFYELGNQLKRTESRYAAEIIENNTLHQKRVCTAEFFAARGGWGAPDPDPIFIVGLPRSGSTLIEQILASHSQVEGTQELANIQQIVHSLRGREPDPENPRYPRVLAELTADDALGLGRRFLDETRVYRLGKPGQVPFFIDKMPNNFRHIGLIRMILPNAKIIDARREPIACCFSNLKQLFAKGQEFSYSVEDIARYYRTYLELMDHWESVLPGWTLRVHHEDVVADLEGSVRRLLEFCGLEFEPQCIEFHRTERSVRTASSEQVRQPINRDGIDQWKNFDPWLGPLKDALGDALTRYRGR